MDKHIPSYLQELYEEQQMDFDPNMTKWEMNERFDLNHHALNRADRRRIKAEYRKQNKKRRK